MSVKRPWSWTVAGLVTVLAGCGSFVPAAADPSTVAQPPTRPAPARAVPDQATYGFYAPYDETASSVVQAPPGFEPFSLQGVGRHGSRATTSSKPVKHVQALCASASTSGELTALGTAFCEQVVELRSAMRRTGYGDLSPLGREQWEKIGERTAQDHRPFFTAASKAKAPVRFFTSDVDRAQDSSDAFRQGLKAETRKLKLKKRADADDLLHFKTPLTAQAREEIGRVERSAATSEAAADVLRRLFGTSSTSLDDARDVWELYAIAPGMGQSLDAYLTPADAAQLAALDDAETFYRYGPGAEGNRAFESASDLRDDLLEVIEHRLAGGTTMATFRHAHAETVVPLAALLRLGPTSVPVPSGTSPGQNGWSASHDAGMAANVDLAAYRSKDVVLVTVRFDEAPVQVMGCRPSTYGPYLYELDTLERCWS